MKTSLSLPFPGVTVLQTIQRVLFLLLAPALVVAAHAASTPTTTLPAIRYHYGDNAAWADARFDDSAWPTAKAGEFPSPAYQSDGFFWVRTQLGVPEGVAGPLAIELRLLNPFPSVQEVWVNGRLVGRYGDFPPHARPLEHPQILVFDLPADVVQPGAAAVVAMRNWNAPDDRGESLLRRTPDPVSVTFSIGSAPLLHALAAQAQDRAWLRFWPQFSLTLAFIMLGLAVLAIGIGVRDRTLLLCALWLVVLPTYLVFRLLPLPGAATPTVYVVFLIINAAGMYLAIEFFWTVQGFSDRIFRTILHFCWIGLTIGYAYAATAMHPGGLVTAGALTGSWLLFAFNVIGSGANAAAVAGWGRNRPVGAAMLLINIGYFLGLAGYEVYISWLGMGLFKAAFYLCTLFIAILLMHQTWTAWRKAESLRVEFAAARELQRELVPASLPPIAGWRMEAAYLPATEVGGDFYHVIEQAGSTILLIGDVSGKGLKAAMTGLLTIGAASALAADCTAPAELLGRLNREMVRLQKGGFITCLCARIAADGTITLANAGHLAPYRNREEIAVASGLPLGIIAEAEYSDGAVRLAAGDALTFLSDGVVEAQNAQGELFGFDQTKAISAQSAEEIARAAEAFGQQDDITVLTLRYAPAEVLQA